MALHLEIDYAKKLGLPGFSSHQCSVSLRTEVATTDDIPAEVARLYALLQQSVDAQIIHPGVVPNGQDATPQLPAQPQAAQPPAHNPVPNQWGCSDKQKQLLIRLLGETGADGEQLAHRRFGKGIRLLNKLEASGLIEELIQQERQAS